MDIQPGFDPIDDGYVGLPTCPITGKVECQERRCELHYMESPSPLGTYYEPEYASDLEWRDV